MTTESKLAAQIAAMSKKQEAVKLKLNQARLQQQKLREMEAARIAAIVGAALVRAAETTQSLKLMLTQVLQSAELSESDRNFLTRKDWY